MLLRSNNLRDAIILMYKAPEMLTVFGEKRDKIERLLFISNAIQIEPLTANMTFEKSCRHVQHIDKCRDIFRHIERLLHIDVQTLVQEGRSDEEISDLRDTKLGQIIS